MCAHRDDRQRLVRGCGLRSPRRTAPSVSRRHRCRHRPTPSCRSCWWCSPSTDKTRCSSSRRSSAATRRPRHTPRHSSLSRSKVEQARQQLVAGRVVTGADVQKQFPDAPKDEARVVRHVAAEQQLPLRVVAAGGGRSVSRRPNPAIAAARGRARVMRTECPLHEAAKMILADAAERVARPQDPRPATGRPRAGSFVSRRQMRSSLFRASARLSRLASTR
jgi:hypothetical protein